MKPSSTPASAEQTINMVLFRLEKQIYTVPITQVRQIIDIVTIHPVPQVNHSVAGMINFHGATVPVVDLRRHLSLPARAPGLHTPIVLVTIAGRMVGLLVDDVLDVLPFEPSQLIRPADVLPDELGDVPLLLGMLQSQRGMLIVLDLEHLFAPQHAQALFAAADQVQKTAEMLTPAPVEDDPRPEKAPAVKKTQKSKKQPAAAGASA